jgi:hypothetical protein
MNSMKKFSTIPVLLLLAAGLIFVNAGCKKIKDTSAEIYVNNAAGNPIAGASVRLFGEGSQQQTQTGEIRFDETKYTDGSGKVFFDYTDYYKAGQAGFAVLNVEIIKDRPAPQTDLFLESIIKIEEQTNNIGVYVLE